MISPETGASLLFAVLCVSAAALFLLWLYENTIRHILIIGIFKGLWKIEEQLDLIKGDDSREISEVRLRVRETLKILPFANISIFRAASMGDSESILAVSDSPNLQILDKARIQLLAYAVFVNAPFRMFFVSALSKVLKTDLTVLLEKMFRILDVPKKVNSFS